MTRRAYLDEELLELEAVVRAEPVAQVVRPVREGVPRAVLEARPRRGDLGAAAGGTAAMDNLHAFMAWQARPPPR